MKAKAMLVLVDDQPTFTLEDGTIIDAEKVGYIVHESGIHPEDYIYDRFTKYDISFIIDNDVQCEIELMDEDGFRTPKLHRGKVIIHFK